MSNNDSSGSALHNAGFAISEQLEREAAAKQAAAEQAAATATLSAASVEACSEATPVATPVAPLTATANAEDLSDISVDLVVKMFPQSERVKNNIEANLPIILQTFVTINFTDRELILMALATIRAETAGFEPISEYKSKYNTSPNGHPFDLYDNRADLGNRGAPDGASYKGRGFIQLTGRHNYLRYSKLLGMGTQLADNPELANDPSIASKILASFISDKQKQIKAAISAGDLRRARRLVNGGSHGLKPFSDAFMIGKEALGL